MGEFKNGQIYGLGKLIEYDNGKTTSVIAGHFNKIKYPRYGVFSHLKHKYLYEGEMKNGKPHGKGILTGKSKTLYEGEFKKGFKHGKGTTTYPKSKKYPKGNKVKGIWKNEILIKIIN